MLCMMYVVLCSSGPILLDWVKRAHGGRFRFSVPALTFNAWAIAACLGFVWTLAKKGRAGLAQLNRPDMLWRFCITSSLFTAGDMLGFMSMQHLDVGTFSLLGKSLAIITTLVLSQVVLRRRHTAFQKVLVVIVAASTVVFCREEQRARTLILAGASGTGSLVVCPTSEWVAGIVQRTAAVCMTSLGAVLQERLLTRDPGISFMVQQCWMGCGALVMSFFTLRCLYGLPASYLAVGFNDWRVLVLLVMYVATGLMTGLIVKRLGAVTKALCVPIYLGGCYLYAVRTGTAALSFEVVVAWTASTTCVLLFAITKAGPEFWIALLGGTAKGHVKAGAESSDQA